MINVLKSQSALLCLVLALKSLWGRSLLGSNHNSAPTFNDTFYGVSVSELACESPRRPSIEIAARMRAAADRGRFFSLVLLPLLSEIRVKTSGRDGGEGEAVQYLFLTVAGCMSKAAGCHILSELETVN